MTIPADIRVVIVDDQPIVRSGLGAFLMAAEGLQLVGEANDGEEAIQLCELVRPDVVLLDIKMPHMDGISAARLIHQRWPDIKILVLTSFFEPDIIDSALEAGVACCLTKDVNSEQLITAIRGLYTEQEAQGNQVVNSRVQSGPLQRLQREIQHSTPDVISLAGMLGRHLPRLFPVSQIWIRLFPAQDLLVTGVPGSFQLDEPAWKWLRSHPRAHLIDPGAHYPWGGTQAEHSGLIMAPVYAGKGGQAIGGIAVQHPGPAPDLRDVLPMVEKLAELVARAIATQQGRAGHTAQPALSYELAEAARIQASILPEKAPIVRGWELSARLQPARETSGDFYDFIPLANENLGIVIADVTDKGMGAAVFMAMCSSLVRTYAIQYPTLPAFAMGLVNERILSDTRGSMFVTVFYGVLEFDTGRLRYVNAGHNPPILISGLKGKPIDQLRPTGPALGILENGRWQQKIARFTPGDLLVLYTDGVTEAQNSQGDFFGVERLLRLARGGRNQPARQVQETVFKEVFNFAGAAPMSDDMAVMIITRQKSD